MDYPQRQGKFIHIAGTNGKGSTAAIIDAILSRAGYRVGRFTSPHIHSYTERFTVNNCPADVYDLLRYLDEVEEKIMIMLGQGMEHPSEFEILTAIAFRFFQEQQVDVAILETGLGGRYDSTNVTVPMVSVITSIDYDHMTFLGDTIEEIAANKAGIIKKGVPVAVGNMAPEPFRVVAEKAYQEKAVLYSSSMVRVNNVSGTSPEGQVVDISYPGHWLHEVLYILPGNFQRENLATALAAIMILQQQGIDIGDQCIREGLSDCRMPGRMEVLAREPLVICDVGHNPQAANAVAAALESWLPERGRVLVCGISDDKDAEKILKYLGEQSRCCVFTRPEGGRGRKWKRLSVIWHSLFPDKPCYNEEEITAAVNLGVNLHHEDEYILITGSFYIMDQARRFFISR